MPHPYIFTVMFEVKNDDLEARLDMPENFLKEDPKHQVSIIHGLREQFRSMDLGDLQLTSSYDTTENKLILISEYGDLFPMKSIIKVEYEKSSGAYTISLQHDKMMSSIPQIQQPILVALVIAALTSAGTLIVASNEGFIK